MTPISHRLRRARLSYRLGPPPPLPMPADSTQDLTALAQIDNPAQFVHEMYQKVLGRTSDLAGFAHYRNLLLSGVARHDVVALVAASPEARGRNIRFTWQGSP